MARPPRCARSPPTSRDGSPGGCLSPGRRVSRPTSPCLGARSPPSKAAVVVPRSRSTRAQAPAVPSSSMISPWMAAGCRSWPTSRPGRGRRWRCGSSSVARVPPSLSPVPSAGACPSSRLRESRGTRTCCSSPSTRFGPTTSRPMATRGPRAPTSIASPGADSVSRTRRRCRARPGPPSPRSTPPSIRAPTASSGTATACRKGSPPWPRPCTRSSSAPPPSSPT